MKNKEKFKNEIVDIVCDYGDIGVNKETYTPVPCCKISCDKCLFYDEKLSCVGALVNWSNQEYKEPIVISFNDAFFIGFIKDKFKYIARDENGDLYAHAIEPKKYKECGIWIGTDDIDLFKFNIDLPMVKFTDVQAWKIADLKKLKLVKNY